MRLGAPTNPLLATPTVPLVIAFAALMWAALWLDASAARPYRVSCPGGKSYEVVLHSANGTRLPAGAGMCAMRPIG